MNADAQDRARADRAGVKALPAGLTRAELTTALQGHVKASARLIGRFRYPR